jgi:hypothetical protein
MPASKPAFLGATFRKELPTLSPGTLCGPGWCRPCCGHWRTCAGTHEPECGTSPALEPVHQLVDTPGRVRHPAIVDQDVWNPRVVPVPGFVALDRCSQLGRDRHSPRLLALGAGAAAYLATSARRSKVPFLRLSNFALYNQAERPHFSNARAPTNSLYSTRSICRPGSMVCCSPGADRRRLPTIFLRCTDTCRGEVQSGLPKQIRKARLALGRWTQAFCLACCRNRLWNQPSGPFRRTGPVVATHWPGDPSSGWCGGWAEMTSLHNWMQPSQM